MGSILLLASQLCYIGDLQVQGENLLKKVESN